MNETSLKVFDNMDKILIDRHDLSATSPSQILNDMELFVTKKG